MAGMVEGLAMSRRIFQTPAIVTNITTLKDRGCKITTVTRELDADEMTALFGLYGKEGWQVIAPNEIQRTDVPDEPAVVEAGDKSPGKRMKGVLYRIWERTNMTEDFNTVWYPRQMERLIDKLKEQLD
jgi:hypothetical protein